jgi:REP element-mobilizing transposase RayT
MPKRWNKDYPGAWWHVMNRGADGCVLFHDKEEGRYFLSLLARAVRWGWLEIHAWCLMPNHFHLEVRSPCGKLAEAMQWIEHRYAVWFNARHDRQGTLFQGRYRAKLILSDRYRSATFLYIHENPARAHLDEHPDVYWDSSAEFHLTGRGRPWLSRRFGRTVNLRRDHLPPELMRRWLQAPAVDLRRLDALLQGSAEVVRTWMRTEASRHAGSPPIRPLVLPSTLRSVLRQTRREMRQSGDEPRTRVRNCWDVLLVGLLHTVCGLNLTEAGSETGWPASTVSDRVRRHFKALMEDDGYLGLSARVLRYCLHRDYGRP